VGDMLSTLDFDANSMFSASLIVEYQSFGLIEIIKIQFSDAGISVHAGKIKL
jgi:hypothetical protein